MGLSNIMKTEIFFNFLKKASRFIIITLLSFTLTLAWTPASLGQFLPISSSAQEIPQLPRWDPNKAKQCGNFWCSQVNFYADNKIGGELTLGEFIRNPEKPEQSAQETAFELEQRAKLVQTIFKEILRAIVRYRPEPQVSGRKDWRFWLITTENPLHPLTPNIQVGNQNQQTVIFVPEQKELGLVAQTIVTVTGSDAKVNAKGIDELAEIWQENIRESMNNVLWGHEFNLRYPWLRSLMAGAIAVMVLISMQIIRFLRRFLRQWNKSIKQQLEELTNSLTVDPEAVSVEDIIKSPRENIPIKFWLLLLEFDFLAAMLFLEDSPESKDAQAVAGEPKSESPLEKVVSNLRSFFQFLTIIPKPRIIKQGLAKFNLQKQFLLKQEMNLSDLLLRISFLTVGAIILIALGLIVALFLPTRFLVYLFFQQLYLLPLIWIGMLLADQVVDFFIDYALNRWARDGQEKDPSSHRYTLRANTYSKALTNATTIFFTVVGIILTIAVIGINPSVLASAGALAAVFAYLSRNVVEDMINGVLILATDRYAVGDVIDVGGGLSGFVEDMNLYTTSLRNLDGQVIAIPNGKISSVINSTKNWSRVNFTLKISWNADFKKAIKLMRQVAEQMCSEPQWQEMILEPPDILGIDELSHDGILIHLLMKTRPSQQWLVGREFRMRVKQALDEAGISLGVPQREVAVIKSDGHSPENGSNKLLGEVGDREKESI
jgi:small conductance mechanosensitive channel